MTKRNIAVLMCFCIAVAVAACGHMAIAGIKEPALCRSVDTDIDLEVATTAAGGGLNYSISFEPEAGFNLGYISNSGGTPAGCGGVVFPCWGHTTAANASLITPTISDANPFMGSQHLRLAHDPATRTNLPNFGLGVDARFPRSADLSVRPMAANTVSVDFAISNPGGMNYRIQPQSLSQGCLATSALFMYDGSIHILDDQCGKTELQFVDTGASWDTSGAYRNYTVQLDPCNYHAVYSYGGAQIYSGCPIAGTNLEQFLVYGDNYPGSYIDVDNVVLSSLDGGFGDSSQQLLSQCGNGIVEPCNAEQCDDFGADAVCPGRCLPPGHFQQCTCAPICTQASPCPVTNGANGPYLTSSGYYVYSGTSPFISIDTCGSSFDSLLSVATVAAPETPLASNDNCNAGQFGAGSDESAVCFDSVDPFDVAYPSCACLRNPGQLILIRVQMIPSGCGPPPLGHSTMINIRKKVVCEGASVGACCDTNGTDVGCTDNVVAAACVGADKVWTDQGKCDEVACECIPDCTGAACGDDGCGGNCGNCDDGNACNGVETCNANRTCDAGTPLICNDGNACNGVESCIPALGCMPGLLLLCDDGLFCNGIETCNPSSGCVPGTPVNCDDEIDCTVDTCDEPDGACSHDDADCSIPAVSDWGLIVLALLLLVTAKVRFVRPRTAAS